MTVSEYLLRFVSDVLKVKHVFYVAGGYSMHLNHALSENKAITPVAMLHEQSAAIAAQAYAEATGYGVCMVTSGPGVLNALTGVAGAWFDSTNMMVISGAPKTADLESLRGRRQVAAQQIDVEELAVQNMCVNGHTLYNPANLPEVLTYCMAEQATRRPGPIWIDIPLDVQAQEFLPAFTASDYESVTQQRERALEHIREGFTPHSVQVHQAIDALTRSERPLLLLGNGARGANIEGLKSLRIPIATTWRAQDLCPCSDPLSVGNPGTLGWRSTNLAVMNCDFLFSIGARLDGSLTANNPANFAPQAFKAAVDIDMAELDPLPFDLKIEADSREFTEQFLNSVIKHEILEKWEGWLTQCRAWKAQYPVVLPKHRTPGPGVSVYHFAEFLSETLPPDWNLVTGSSGHACEIFLHAWSGTQRSYHTAGLGAMGFGLPSAIGVCLATGKPTVLIDGDGGFQLNIQELEVVRRLRLPIVMFVMDNGGYASIEETQSRFFGKPQLGCNEETGLSLPNPTEIARAYGIDSWERDEYTDAKVLFNDLTADPKPTLCRLCVRKEPREPRVQSKQLPDGSFTSGGLLDLWPPLETEEPSGVKLNQST